MPASIAQVATDRPARYLKQLASHFSNRVGGELENDHAQLDFDFGTLLLDTAEGSLVMRRKLPTPSHWLASNRSLVATWSGSARRTSSRSTGRRTPEGSGPVIRGHGGNRDRSAQRRSRPAAGRSSPKHDLGRW